MIRQFVENRHGYMLMDSSDIVEASRLGKKWMKFQSRFIHGHFDVAEFERKATVGENSYVARSDAFLEKIESLVPMSRGWSVVDDVVGALPNVPSFLAGHPQHMRRRQRVAKDSAPLTIFMNLASSASISRETILNRGIVLLALVRLLVEHRPVELWVGTHLGNSSEAGTAAWRIDTAPLDLARAAFHIADVSMSRLFGYAMCETTVDEHLGGSAHEKRGIDGLKRLAGWDELLYVPGIHSYDPMVSNPVGWLKETLSKYLKQEEE